MNVPEKDIASRIADLGDTVYLVNTLAEKARRIFRGSSAEQAEYATEAMKEITSSEDVDAVLLYDEDLACVLSRLPALQVYLLPADGEAGPALPAAVLVDVTSAAEVPLVLADWSVEWKRPCFVRQVGQACITFMATASAIAEVRGRLLMTFNITWEVNDE